MDELDLNLYILAEIKYKKEHKKEETDKLFPLDWYSNKNYKLKIEIITEALKKNIRIEDTTLYQESFIEGHKYEKNISKNEQ